MRINWNIKSGNGKKILKLGKNIKKSEIRSSAMCKMQQRKCSPEKVKWYESLYAQTL